MGLVGGSLPEVSVAVGPMKDSSSSEASAIVKSEKVAMLVDGEWVVGDSGNMSVSGATVSSGRGEGIRGSRSLLGSPRDVGTGVAAGSFCLAPAGFGFPVANTGGVGRPSQPRSRNATNS